MRRRTLALAVVAAWLLAAGCGQSPEQRLERANMAIAHRQSRQALELAEGVLKDQPGNLEAMLVKARAQIMLPQMAEARATLDAAIEQAPDAVAPRELLITWCRREIALLLRKSDFMRDADMQQRYKDALAAGHREADWLAAREGQAGEAFYQHANLTLHEADFVARELGKIADSLEAETKDPARRELAKEQIAAVEARHRAKLAEAEAHLREAIAAQPDHFAAARGYVRLLRRRDAWAQLLGEAERIADHPHVPAGLAGDLVVAMIQMPESVHPRDGRLRIAWKLQSAVREPEQQTADWLRAGARLHLMQQEPEKALAMLDAVLAAHADDVDARFLKAHALYMVQRYHEAKDILEKLSLVARNSDEVQTLYGQALVAVGEPGLAKVALARAVELNPDNTVAQDAYNKLVAAQDLLPQHGDQIVQEYLRRPHEPVRIQWVLRYHHGAADFEAYREVLRKVEQIDPLTPAHLRLLVDAYTDLGEWDQAEFFARRLVADAPDEPAYRARLIETLVSQEKMDAAARALAETAQRFPEMGSADQLRGEVYIRLTRFAEATPILERVVAAEPDNDRARLILARALANGHRGDEALEYIEGVLGRRPHDLDANDMATRIYRVLGREEMVEKCLGGLEADAVDARTHPALAAQVQMHADRPDAAIDICRRAIGDGSRDPFLRLLLARCLIRQKDFDQAGLQLRSLVRSIPMRDNPQAYALLARYFIMRRDFDAGVEEFVRLEGQNRVLARQAQAIVLMAAGQRDEALRRLGTTYDALLEAGDQAAIRVADALARVYAVGRDIDGALGVYERMVAADLQPVWARLRQIDVRAAADQRDEALAAIDRLADSLEPGAHQSRMAIMRRCAGLRAWDRALALVDQMGADVGENAVLLQWKGELLLGKGEIQDGIAAFARALELMPDSVSLHRQAARAHLAAHDHPAAVAIYERMGRLGSAAEVTALIETAQLYLDIGLNGAALTCVERLEQMGKARQPAGLLVMGQAYRVADMSSPARDRLTAIPLSAPEYPVAQLLLVRIEQETGNIEEAHERFEDLVSRKRLLPAVVPKLLLLKVSDPRDRDLLELAERLVAVDDLPPPLRLQWLRVKVTMSSRARDWGAVLVHLEQMQKLQPGSPLIDAGRLVLMLHLRRTEQAARLYASLPKLGGSRMGRLIATLVEADDAPVAEDADKAGGAEGTDEDSMARYLRALIGQDIDEARAAVEGMATAQTVFRADLRAVLDRNDIKTRQTADHARGLGRAVVAMATGLNRLAEVESERVARLMPGLAPAYSLLALARLQSEDPVDPTLALTQQGLPGSLLERYLTARQAAAGGDWGGAVDQLRVLLEMEPDHRYVQHELADALQRAGRGAEAIPVLEAITRGTGPFRLAAANDLAYLLAEHQPQRLEEAYALAVRTRKATPANLALRDTVGWLEFLRDRPEVALQELRRVVRGLRGVSDVHYHLGKVYTALGDDAWAKRHLKQAATGPADRAWQADVRQLLGR